MDAVFKMENAVFNYRAAGILIEDGHVLLHKQTADEHWALPGGRVKVLEDSKTGLAREILEELGLSIQVSDLLWTTENFFEHNQSQFHEIGFYYRIFSKNAIQLRKDAFHGLEGNRLTFQWIPLTDLEHLALYPEFLKSGLQDLPQIPQHLIIRN